jgi:hypothetical protein
MGLSAPNNSKAQHPTAAESCAAAAGQGRNRARGRAVDDGGALHHTRGIPLVQVRSLGGVLALSSSLPLFLPLLPCLFSPLSLLSIFHILIRVEETIGPSEPMQNDQTCFFSYIFLIFL